MGRAVHRSVRLPALVLFVLAVGCLGPKLTEVRVEVGEEDPPIVNGAEIPVHELAELLRDASEREPVPPVTIALRRGVDVERLVTFCARSGLGNLPAYGRDYAVELPAPSDRSGAGPLVTERAPAIVWLWADGVRVGDDEQGLLDVEMEDILSFAAMSVATDPRREFVLAIDPGIDPELVTRAVRTLRNAKVLTLYGSAGDGFERIEMQSVDVRPG